MHGAAHHSHGIPHHVRATTVAHCLHAAVQGDDHAEDDLVGRSGGVELAVASHGGAVAGVDQRQVALQPQRMADVDFCSSMCQTKSNSL